MGLRSLSKGNLESITFGPNFQGKIIRDEVPDSLREQSLQLGLTLQTTLDVYELIRKFHKEIQKSIGNQYLEYQNNQTGHGLAFGTQTEHEVEYDLEIDNQYLGHIKIAKNEAFTKQALFTLENAITHLLYPLRNAIKYHQAIVHALTCPVTKLGNKKAYLNTINREVDFASRHQTPLSVLVLDIDNFKKINDTYGHQAGDAVLEQLGQLMTQINRNSDIAFRYGGEEFVIILSNTPSQGALEVAKRIQHNIQNTEFTYLNDIIPVTLSIGIAEYSQDDTPDRLFTRADQALYQAKHTGKNKIICWD